MKVTKENSEEYDWGQKCKGWHLVNTTELSVIQEIMPSGTKEIKHKHSTSQQFFFIIKGVATFLINGEKHIINSNQGIHIQPNIFHQISNETNENLEFIVVSQPHSHGDRIIENDRNKNT